MSQYSNLSTNQAEFLKKKAGMLVGLFFIIVVLLLSFFYFKDSFFTVKKKVSVVSFRSALELTVSGSDSKPLQEFFVNQVKNNVNDKETKSAIYWITHRYFDNGGNIYEIYDFINAHPEIAFLKEAEKIYPKSFNTIKTTKVANWSDESVLALLAYYEVIDNHGYADVALWGMAGNISSSFALGAHRRLVAEPNKSYGPEVMKPAKVQSLMAGKAKKFTANVIEFLDAKTQKTKTLEDLYSIEMIPDDLLVGLNQYASAIQNLKGIGVIAKTTYSTLQIYEFNNKLAQTKVPRLYFFTNYLYAVSLVYGGDATALTVKVPLQRLVEYAETTNKTEWRKSVYRVINSKTAHEKGMYSYEASKKLASLDSGFKNWLTKNGWTGADF